MTGNEIATAIVEEMNTIFTHRLSGYVVFERQIFVQPIAPGDTTCYVCGILLKGSAINLGCAIFAPPHICCDRVACRERAAEHRAQREGLLQLHVKLGVNDPADA